MSGINGSNNGTALLHGIRELYAKADAKGDPRPGRPTLVKLLAKPPEVTEHQVRKAKDLVDAEASLTPVAASDTPALPTSPPVEPPLPPDQAPLPAPEQTPAQAAGDSPDPDVTSPTPARQDTTRPPRPWPLVLIGLAAAVAVWSGWVGLGKLAGFGLIQPLPGIADGFTLDSAIVLPISVEAYAAYALRVWLSTSRHSDRTIAFARKSAIGSLVIGGAAQVAYHLMAAAGLEVAPWWVTMLVALVPVVVLGLASALAKLVTSDRQAGGRQ